MRALPPLLALLLFVGCGGSTEPAPTSSSSPSASPSGTPATNDPAAFEGVFHHEQVDATNLRIDSDGHFHWTIEGCDFSGGDEGRWKAHPEGGILLEPANGYDYFEWSSGGFRDRAVALRLTLEGDVLTVKGTMDNGEPISQTWKAGCVCPVCGGNLGPTGQNNCPSPTPDICQVR